MNNRPIKFRGKSKETGKWVYGYYIYSGLKHYIADNKAMYCEKVKTITNLTEVIPETVSQSTGLKDKNEAVIFEGDIMTFNPTQPGVWPDQCKPHEVKYPYLCGNSDFGEIIGNVTDTPELMKG